MWRSRSRTTLAAQWILCRPTKRNNLGAGSNSTWFYRVQLGVTSALQGGIAPFHPLSIGTPWSSFYPRGHPLSSGQLFRPKAQINHPLFDVVPPWFILLRWYRDSHPQTDCNSLGSFGPSRIFHRALSTYRCISSVCPSILWWLDLSVPSYSWRRAGSVSSMDSKCGPKTISNAVKHHSGWSTTWAQSLIHIWCH